MDDIDHRSLGNRLDLFHQQEDGPGMVFWHPRGWALYRVVEDHVRRRMARAGYREVRTPQLLARGLWNRSGHWQKFGAQMYAVADEGRIMALKPMSCPGHVQIFNKRVRSHRELPIRYFEFGAVHRNEPSGALQGLMRARGFVQDDAHVFCLEQQVEAEVARFCSLLRRIYADFGFDHFDVAFATRPAQRAGSDEVWDRAEAALADAARQAGLDFETLPGEGAFYGPKLEFHLRDSRGRRWQCGVIQLDLVMPERLGAAYVDEHGNHQLPVMLHHAVLGSLERFIGILLEHHEGKLPLWLAPEQLVVASIGADDAVPACRVAEAFEAAGLRVALDARPERLSRKIVDAHADGVPVLAAIGAREARDGTVALRFRDGRQESLPLAAAIARLEAEAQPPAEATALAA
ncbi:threonine--tRNA ligase [Mycobacterium sp. KBS0706]|uniref:threonine--tRNA ligase n=1 Tax=Mycobacterium sp. KBS0706 TaxID=2578109 RepID=UPI00110F73CD|nr:threonine--tRNA ligase [Mycobacterium sp. KBS0706]TSD88421.1 threonine--tRNA ligase [Mycobacterium sp. KBS0706]